jgi:pimeloyl-ACP methyl ester carboxylesterase
LPSSFASAVNAAASHNFRLLPVVALCHTFQVKTFARNGLTFDVSDVGPNYADVAILLHGFPQTRDCFSDVAIRLSLDGYRTLAFDQRGYSPGARPPRISEYSLGELADDVLCLADKVEAGRFHVIGHDMGAAVGWALASKVPERVASLSILGFPHPRAFLRSLNAKRILRSHSAFFLVPRIPEALLANHKIFVAALRRGGMPRELAQHYARSFDHADSFRGPLNWYRAFLVTKNLKHLKRISVPTLLIYGANDKFVTLRAVELSRCWVNGSLNLQILHSADHWLPDKEAHRVAALISDHLSTNRA